MRWREPLQHHSSTLDTSACFSPAHCSSRQVINYSLGSSVEQYVHRIGRCGRAGRSGVSHTFLIDGDEKHAAELVALLQRSKQPVSYELARLAESAVRGAKAIAVAGGGESGGGLGYVDEEAERLAELRMANRQKQQEQHAARKQKGSAQRNGRERGGGRR